jgi:serine-type D-Ala-D-Ala carboxypeptidase
MAHKQSIKVVEFLSELSNKQVFPGAAVLIARKNHILLRQQFGMLTPESTSAPVDRKTIFDIASITKPVATTTAILQLSEQNSLSLDSAVSLFLPEMDRPDKRFITIRHLLTHTSGLPAWKPLYLFSESLKGMISIIAETELESKPATQVTYSCLGFILLAEVVRRITGETLTSYTRKRIFEPLEMNSTGFNPSTALKPRIAPTELGNQYEQMLAGPQGKNYAFWRKHRLHGEVQDGNSYTANGEGGNAGLFSTVEDLYRFSQCIIQEGSFRGNQILSAESIRESIRNQTQHLQLSRGLGWQMASSSFSTGGAFSASAFGHNGFSGTSFWIDPDLNLIVILLSNRSFYGGNGTHFNQSRAKFHQLAVAYADNQGIR